MCVVLCVIIIALWAHWVSQVVYSVVWIFLKWLTHLYRTIKAIASRKNLTIASGKKILGKIWRIFYFKEGICEEKNATVLSARERLAESVLFFPFFFQFCDVSHSYQHPKKWIFLKWLIHLYKTIKAVASRENLTTASGKKILGKIWRIFYFKEGICEENNAAVLLFLPVQLLQLLSNLVH